MRQLSGLDAGFVNLESPRTPMHLTSLLVYDAATAPRGRLTFDEVMANVGARLDDVPTYRQRLARVPLDLAHPWWVDDEHFDLEFHVRQLALPAPGDWRQLWTQTARLASRPLDLARPPWELYVVEGLRAVEGLPATAVAIVLKTHHAAIDGVSGMQLLSTLQDLSPDPPALPSPSEWSPEPAPTGTELFTKGLRTAFRQPFEMARLGARSVPAIGRVVAGVRRHDLSLPPGLGRAPATRFGGRVSPQRVVGGVAIELDALRAHRAAVPGATINDTLLAIVGGSMRRYLDDRDELPDGPLLAMVPISVRGDDGMAGNQVSVMIVSLATDVADPVERLAAVRDSAVASKALTNAVGARLLTQSATDTPAAITSFATRLAVRANVSNQTRRLFNTVVTNVPGPQVPTYFAGARLLGHYGFGPLQDGAGIFHSLMSADGRVFLSVTACRHMMPDIGAYVEGLRATVEESVAATPGG